MIILLLLECSCCLNILFPPAIAKVHLRSALRLREMCTRNGALFIKVGQYVGSMDYLLPPEYVTTFKLFHRTAPETPLPLLKKVLEDELGRPGQ